MKSVCCALSIRHVARRCEHDARLWNATSIGGLRPQPLYVHHYCFQCTNSIIFGDRAVHNARAGIGNSRHYWTAASNLLALVPLDQALLRT